jgi:hypothetical protein
MMFRFSFATRMSKELSNKDDKTGTCGFLTTIEHKCFSEKNSNAHIQIGDSHNKTF